MSAIEDIYSAGIGEEPDPERATSTAQALASIRTVDKLAALIHRDARNARLPVQHAWGKFFNEWLTYKTLHAERLARSDPVKVLEVDLPRFTKGFYAWRDALATERGTGTGSAAVGRAATQEPASKLDGWRPVLAIGGVIVAGIAARAWWASRQKAREAELAQQMEIERAKILEAAAPTLPGPPPVYTAPPVYAYPYPAPAPYPPYAPPPVRGR